MEVGRIDTGQMPQATPNSPPTLREILASNLIRLRKEKGWSQEALSFEVGLHRTFIAHVERKQRNISLDNLEKLANALAIPVHQLLVDSNTP